MSGKAWSEPATYGPPEQIKTTDGWRVGRRVQGSEGEGDDTLFRVDVTGELLWVDVRDLRRYPASPIEQPGAKRRSKKVRK